MYPNAKFLYIIRNGCDVVQSHRKFPNFQHMDFQQACKRWADGVYKYEYITELGNGLEVRQEDLRDDPETFFKDVLAFLEFEHDDAPCEFAQSTLIHPLDQPTHSDINVKQVLADRPPSHRDWSEQEKDTFGDICGEAMIKQGYELPF